MHSDKLRLQQQGGACQYKGIHALHAQRSSFLCSCRVLLCHLWTTIVCTLGQTQRHIVK